MKLRKVNMISCDQWQSVTMVTSVSLVSAACPGQCPLVSVSSCVRVLCNFAPGQLSVAGPHHTQWTFAMPLAPCYPAHFNITLHYCNILCLADIIIVIEPVNSLMQLL